MASQFNDTGLYTLHLKQIEESLEMFEKHLNTEDLPVFIRAIYADQIGKIQDALLAMQCETCNDPVSVAREAGNFCGACSALFTVCKQCGTDVLVSDSVYYEGGRVHGGCVGPIDAPDKEGE